MARGTNKRDEGEAAANVMRITAAGKERHYIAYATGLLLEKGPVLHTRQMLVPQIHVPQIHAASIYMCRWHASRVWMKCQTCVTCG